MPELDVLRGLAILGVFVLHFYSHSFIPGPQDAVTRLITKISMGGGLGVPLFFVLSGYLITGILLDTRKSPNYYRRFYVRRALRILPAYLFTISVLLITGVIAWQYALISIAFLSNYSGVLGNPPGYSVFWSLAVEEHFYFAWPLITRITQGRRLAYVAGSLLLIAPVLRLMHFLHGDPGADAYYTWCNMDGLALGALTCLLVRRLSEQPKRIFTIGTVMMGSVFLLVILGRSHGIATRSTPLGVMVQPTLIYVFFSSLVLLLTLLANSPWHRFTRNRVLEFFGYISYGLYLYHPFFRDTYDAVVQSRFPGLLTSTHYLSIRFAIAGGMAVLFSFLSRRFFEDRILRLKNRWG